MKVFKKGFTNVALAIALGFGAAFAGVSGVISAIRANAETTALENEFTNNGQFVVGYYTGNTAFAYTFVNGEEEDLPAGCNGAVVKAASLVTGGAPYINIDFTASKIAASMVESVVARVYSPDYTSADELRINNISGSMGGVGAHDLSTWYDVALPIATITGADGNLGSFAFGLRDKGTVSDYFYIDSITVNMKETTKVAFTDINAFWNNYAFSDTYCSILNFSGGIVTGNIDGNYTDVLAKATIDGQPIDSANLSFICRAWLDGAADSIVMRWVTLPASGAIFCIPAGARFTNGSSDANVYEFAADMYLQLNGTVWQPYTPPVEPEMLSVTYTNINSTWNNYAYDDAYCTFLHFDGGISGNGGLDADFSDLLAKMTVNGQPADISVVSFRCPNWVGASGGIMMRLAQMPAAGTKIVLPAGAAFNIGGTDSNTYEITSDVILIFNGTTWTNPAIVSYTVIKVSDPYEAETLTTYDNGDGTVTYTLPEYTREGKVLLGYVENRMAEGALVQTFLPAGEYTTDGTGLTFIALWGAFTTENGASIRIASAETSGIRWTTNIDAEGFNNIAYWTQGRFVFGTELSADGFGENFDITAKNWKVENSQYTGVLIDINSQYYNTAFTARGYVDITYSNGVSKRIYATANDTTRSIAQVASRAIASGDYTGMQLSILEEIAGV